jgi:branched-chain amino acid aminotransferase
MVLEERTTRTGADLTQGAAIVGDSIVPIAEAVIPMLDWGFVRSDVTYDVVHVWKGSFFRLDDHISRFQASMAGLRMQLPFDAGGLKQRLLELVAATGLRDSYVAMICTRGAPIPGLPRHPKNCENRFFAFAIPFVWQMPREKYEDGARFIVAKTPRIPADSVDPTIKNYHWGDFTRALFEADDAGADNAILLDRDGYVTEGPGFNVFAVVGGIVVSPDHGALEGITRQSVFDLCADSGRACRVQKLHVDTLRAAEEIFTATTAGGILPVISLDGRPVGGGSPGAITRHLRDTYWRQHDEGWHATPVPYA